MYALHRLAEVRSTVSNTLGAHNLTNTVRELRGTRQDFGIPKHRLAAQPVPGARCAALCFDGDYRKARCT